MASGGEGPELVARLLDRAPLGLAAVDADGTLAWTNAAFDRLLGGGASTRGTALASLPSLGLSDRGRALATAVGSRSPCTFRAVPVPAPGGDGRRFLDLELAAPESPGPSPALLMAVDVTEQVHDRDRAQLFYASFLTSTNAIEVTDARGVLTDVNPAFEKIYGYTRAECVGRRPNLVRGRSAPPELFERMWHELLDPSVGHWSGELVNRDRHGNERPVFLTITAIRDPTGTTTHYLGVAVNLGERKTWERAAAHSEKLASIGQLAAGVAHEINTPLANVMLITESLRRRSTDPWVQARLDRISGQVEAAGKIVRGLLDFSRRGEPQVRRVELNEVVHESLAFLRGKQSHDLELDERPSATPLTVWGDRGQLIQVITNIVNNGSEAMAGKGRIVVELRRNGSDAEVEIVDTGPGIPESVLPHIFEPFFTTKPEGQGTGLGLAVCHGIVQAHHGTLRVRNPAGGGASFTIALPISEAEPPPPLPGRSPVSAAAGDGPVHQTL